jgi:hypothetical protein
MKHIFVITYHRAWVTNSDNIGGWVESMSTREIPFLLCLFTSKNSDFLYSVVNYSDFANNHNKDEIKELLQPRSPAFGRGIASAFSGRGAGLLCS